MIRILDLYYDLMNLYGDNGNIKALKKALESQNINVTIDYLTINDKIDFDIYDVIYIGPGTFNNELLVLNDLIKYREDIRDAVEKKKFFIITGNALELFGKTIDNIEALGIFEFDTKKTDKRLVDEVYAKTTIVDEIILGFKNQDGEITSRENGIFNILRGIGFNKDSKQDGFLYNNFLGTYLIGPILVRNPKLLEYFTRKIIDENFDNFKYKTFDFELETKAHDEYIKNYFEQK